VTLNSFFFDVWIFVIG